MWYKYRVLRFFKVFNYFHTKKDNFCQKSVIKSGSDAKMIIYSVHKVLKLPWFMHEITILHIPH